jgi:curved DNA-binding protein CbpA
VTAFDPYKVLQVDPEAEPEVIEAAFRRLARKYHPDLAPGPDAAERMVALNRAWELLRDPVRRASVDQMRRDEPAGRSAERAAGRSGTPDGGAPRAANPATGTAPRTPGRAETPGASAGGRAWGTAPPGTGDRDWTSGRSSFGSGYDPATMRAPDTTGAAGPPPGNPSGSVITFGRYAGWSLGEIARADLEFLEWLDRMPIGRPYRVEIEALLRRAGRRRPAAESGERRGLFRRR